ncbi:uncharacterized protein LOC133850441 [Drosophila sulfurigaster albostrigata]|uniref:uncharacterized protein LOC133850441 n=1 Tax=Drosophila sulfurigaster albostrigata TaxID=89887 RepID=UPI002D21B02B|nr:uncharacterized protein LOC133850441 [Drosophila sulfurigaster albostrigata]
MARPVSGICNPLYQRMSGETFCGVCSEEVEYPAQLLTTSCNHYFHHICFSTATENDEVCPSCKTALSKSMSLAEELSAAQSSEEQTLSKFKNKAVAQNLLITGSSNIAPTGMPELVQPNSDLAPVVPPMVSLQQSIAEDVATQHPQDLSKASEGGFHRLSVNSAAQVESYRVDSAPRQLSSARQRQHQSIEQLLWALRSSRQLAENVSPYCVAFGQHMILNGNTYPLLRNLELLENRTASFHRADSVDIIRQTAQQSIKRKHEEKEEQYNLRSREVDFRIGPEVDGRRFQQNNFEKGFNAPLALTLVKSRVKHKLGHTYYELGDTQGRFILKYHVKDLKTINRVARKFVQASITLWSDDHKV